MKNKKFDCVEMKRKSQEMIYNEIKNMSVAEELDFWNKGTAKLKKQQNTVPKDKALKSKMIK